MLFNFNSKTRFFFFNGPTDMRKGINSLYAVVKSCNAHLCISNFSQFTIPNISEKKALIIKLPKL